MSDKIISDPVSLEPAALLPGSNQLFPVFLKLENLSLLIVGGGYVGMEKLNTVLQNSPAANIRIVATHISDEIKELVGHHNNIELIERPYEACDIDGMNLVIVAVNEFAVSELVSRDAKQKGVLVNAADKPGLCDFYLGSVVQKGSLKIAISTNGKSPTIAKRVKEVLNETLPDEIDNLLDNMQSIRNKLSGDFAEKVKQLNEITKRLSQEK
ncbi:MAG: bifunctional precorrin-2 dehydrogenase/sirohydrochlorin ferrochelatase [Ferruginibacter sp.]